MSVGLACPNCRKWLLIADTNLGKGVRCPHCSQAFRTPAADAPAATITSPPLVPPVAAPTPASAVPAETLDAGASTAVVAAIPVHAVAPSAVDGMPERIGRFVLRQRLGEGAFGVVYRAHDPQLDREVALKVAKPGSLNTPQRVERFLREAKAAAPLRHPHIVPLFDAGRDGEHSYIAVAFIAGRTLEAEIEAGGLDVRRAAAVVRALAEALAYAHAQGIVHRDVKPANIMLEGERDGDGPPVPLLMDFGLAARQEEAEKLTQDGAILGTPLYMAPEQARGKSGEALPASDQYSLGVLFYELLTGQTPFAGTPEVVIFNHLNVEPRSPRLLNRRLPRDLETICLKCLEKDPSRRYADCQALADDLRRWLEGDPIQARRLRLVERLWRWARREPRLAAAMSVAGAALVAVALIMSVNARDEAKLRKDASDEAARANLAADLAEKNATRARAEEKLAGRHLYSAQMQVVHNAWRDARLSYMDELLDRQVPRPGEEDLRSFEWHYLKRLAHPKNRELPWPREGNHGTLLETSVGFAPDGTCLLAADRLNKLFIRPPGDRQARTVSLPASKPTHLLMFPPHCFSRDGTRMVLVVVDDQARVSVCDTRTGKEVFAVPSGAHSTKAALSSDGQLLAVGGLEDGLVQLWDTATGKESRRFVAEPTNGPSWQVEFSPDGKLIAAAMRGLHIWEVDGGKRIFSAERTTQGYRRVTFSSDGKRLASGGGDGGVKVWDIASGKEVMGLRPHTGSIEALAFAPDNRLLASAGADQIVAVSDTTNSMRFVALRGHLGTIHDLAFSPVGTYLASSGTDAVRFWDMPLQAQEHIYIPSPHPNQVNAVTFSPDSQRILTGAPDLALKVWDTNGKLDFTIPSTQVTVCVAYSPDGKRLASAGLDAVQVWDLAARREVFRHSVKRERPLALQFSSDSTRLLYVEGDGTVKVVEAATGCAVRAIASTPSPLQAAFSPDGRWVACIGTKDRIEVWDLQKGSIAHTLQLKYLASNAVLFGPDSRLLACGTMDGEVHVLDALTGERRFLLTGHSGISVGALAFTPDGKRLATAGMDKSVKLWDLAVGGEVLTLRGHLTEINALAFSPDGRRLASVGGWRELLIWDGRPLQAR